MIRRSTQSIIIVSLATLGLIAADLGSKVWAANTLSTERATEPPPVCEGQGDQRLAGDGIVLIEGYLEFRYAENCGAAFGLMRRGPSWLRHLVFELAAAAATIVLSVMFVRGRGGRLFAFSVPLIISGAVGNLVDRLRLGYVVDFIHFHIQTSFSYPTFNVADITITVGVALLMLDGFRREPNERKDTGGKKDGETGKARRKTSKTKSKRSAKSAKASKSGSHSGAKKSPAKKSTVAKGETSARSEDKSEASESEN